MKDGTFTADRLLALYDRVAEAEDAIPRLRRFVLDLAVRGKLVEQDPTDEPAAELLKQIAKEKARLVKAGGLRPSKAAEPAMVEAPFDLPFNWAWAAIGTVFIYDAGDKCDPKELDQSLWLLELEDVEKDTGRLIERITTDQRESQSTKSQFRAGDILYGKLRPYLNKVLVADEPGYSTTEIVALRPYLALCSGYCALALRRPDFVEYVTRLGQGTKMPRLRTEDAVVAPFPLPPLAEQRRIVAKVDELMALCDRLEAARAGREAVRDRLTAATLTRLTAPETDAESFLTHARFALQTLPTLTTRPDQVKTLRQTILNLAVRGKLVEQDPTDEPAAELLKRIEDSPKRSMRGRESSSEEAAVKPPHYLPDQWEWTTFGELQIEARVGLDRGKAQQGPQLAFAYFKMNNIVNDGGIDMSSLARIDASALEVKSFQLENGDFLFNTRNSRELVGKTCVFRLNEPEIFLFNNNILRARFHPDVCPDFVDVWFRSPIGKELIEGLKSNTTNVCAIYQGKLFTYPCPLPPLAEQHRIVAKVDALMALCDQLEASLTTATTTRSRLLEALLHEALGGTTEAAA